MAESLLGSTILPDTATLGGHRMLGHDLVFAVPGTIVGYRWYNNGSTAITGALFLQGTQALLHSQAFGTPTAGWNEVATLFTITPGVLYTVADAIDGGDLVYDADGLTGVLTVGNLTAPAGSGRFKNFGTGVEYPDQGTGNELFPVDVLFEAATGGVLISLPPHLLLQFAARNQAQWTAGPVIGGPVDLDGAGSAVAAGTATIAVDRSLTATGPVVSAAVATAAVARGLIATSPAVAVATATLATDRPFTATASAAASASGDLTIQGQVTLAGVAPTVASATAALTRAVALAGVAAAATSAGGTAAVSRPLTGVAASAAQAAADLAILAPYVPARIGVDSSTTAGTLDNSSRQPAELGGTSTTTQVDP